MRDGFGISLCRRNCVQENENLLKVNEGRDPHFKISRRFPRVSKKRKSSNDDEDGLGNPQLYVEDKGWAVRDAFGISLCKKSHCLENGNLFKVNEGMDPQLKNTHRFPRGDQKKEFRQRRRRRLRPEEKETHNFTMR